MVRDILIWPDPRLKEKAKPVKGVDASLRTLIDDMFETMYAAQGVGLAAPQIGVLQRVIVIDTSPKQEGAIPTAFVNPEILDRQGNTIYREGCLSVPGEAEEVERAATVRVRALGRDGKQFELDADGLLAIALQHEIDHLDGTLFVDYLSTLKRELIRKRMKRLKADRANGEPVAPQAEVGL
jgi:peptide deformylase